MVLNLNSAMFAYRQMGLHNTVMSRAVQRLSSGKRINNVRDDAAGYMVSAQMRTRIDAMRRAARDTHVAESQANTEEAKAGAALGLLRQMRELATAAASGTASGADRAAMQAEMNQYLQELGHWRGLDLGVQERTFAMERQSRQQMTGGVWRVDAAGQVRNTTPGAAEGAGLFEQLLGSLDMTTQTGAMKAMEKIDRAMEEMAGIRARLGVEANGHAHSAKLNEEAADILEEAESNITDADMAKEMVNFVRGKALGQVAGAMMVHAMKAPEKTVQLLEMAAEE